MGKRIDLTGKTFGDLTVVCPATSNQYHHACWVVKCVCGQEKPVDGVELRRGKITSCGSCGQPRRLSVEKQQVALLDRREKAAQEMLKDPAISPNKILKFENELRNVIPKARLALAEKIAQRKKLAQAARDAEQSQREIAKAQELFPELTVPADERQERMAQLTAYLGTLTARGSKEWVEQRIRDIRYQNILDREREEAARIEAEETQRTLDADAATHEVEKLYARVNQTLSTLTDQDERWKLQAQFKSMATASRKFAKNADSHKAAIANALAEAFKELDARLDIFDCSQHISNQELERKHAPDGSCYFADFACSPCNWSFRDLNEKSKLRHCASLHYASTGVHHLIAKLPAAPPPVFMPTGNAPVGPEHGQQMQRQAEAVRLYNEEIERQRVGWLKKLETEDPAEFKKLQQVPKLPLGYKDRTPVQQLEYLRQTGQFKELHKLASEILSPVKVDTDLVVYKVPRNTVEQPNLPPEWFWPDGRKVAMGELHYDVPSKTYCLKPDIELEAFPAKKPTSDVVRATGGNGWSEPGEVWEQNKRGEWIQVRSGQSQWQRPQRIRFAEGQRQPEGKRHFLHGWWYSDAEIAASTTLGPIQMPSSGFRRPADSISTPVPHDADSVGNRWARQSAALHRPRTESSLPESPWQRLERERIETIEAEKQFLRK